MKSHWAHAVLTLCSHCAHAMLTLCSHRAHAVLTLCRTGPSHCAHTVSHCAQEHKQSSPYVWQVGVTNDMGEPQKPQIFIGCAPGPALAEDSNDQLEDPVLRADCLAVLCALQLCCTCFAVSATVLPAAQCPATVCFATAFERVNG
jgi:hypothetical protein